MQATRPDGRIDMLERSERSLREHGVSIRRRRAAEARPPRGLRAGRANGTDGSASLGLRAPFRHLRYV